MHTICFDLFYNSQEYRRQAQLLISTVNYKIVADNRFILLLSADIHATEN